MARGEMENKMKERIEQEIKSGILKPDTKIESSLT
jgi:DNA-binding GntR family transcriptional regulator